MGATAEMKVDGGLRAFQSAVDAARSDTRRALDAVCRKAGELVAKDARRRVPTRSGRAAGSIKSVNGLIMAGGSRAPYYPWLDFGGRVGRSRSVNRPVVRGGRYLYRSLSLNKARIGDMLQDGLVDLAESNGLVVR